MQMEFVGAAQTVTGSKHLLRTKHANVLLDCGFFQGRRRESIDRNKNLSFEPGELDAVVLSHAHIDHSGALPLLMRMGYDGPVYATPATRDLCAAMLADAAAIQESDARYINKIVAKGETDMEHVDALYSEQDVVNVLEHMVSIPYHRKQSIAPRVTLSFLDAGHVLGSAISILDVEDEGQTKRIVFTGDLGRKRMPILRDPEAPEGAYTLITESTYGDRLHKPIEEMDDLLAGVMKRVYERGGKVIIPSFALERAQEIVFALKALKKQGRMPNMLVYVDSPLTVKITDSFKLHPECYDDETSRTHAEEPEPVRLRSAQIHFGRRRLEGAHRRQPPRRHHLGERDVRSGTHRSSSQRRDREREERRPDRGLPSAAHARAADRREARAREDLRRRARSSRGGRRAQRLQRARRSERPRRVAVDAKARGPLAHVALVHGEPGPQRVLAGLLAARGISDVRAPALGDKMEV